jgi:hypothetical protein
MAGHGLAKKGRFRPPALSEHAQAAIISIANDRVSCCAVSNPGGHENHHDRTFTGRLQIGQGVQLVVWRG